MNEKHMGEVERQLLQISRSRGRLREAASELAHDGAEAHLVEALTTADRAIEKVYKRLFQETYFHVPETEPVVRRKDQAAGVDEPVGQDELAQSQPDAESPAHVQETLIP